jgi:hypothetical protein
MKYIVAGLIPAAAFLLAPDMAFAQGTCTRDGLKAVTAAYINAQKTGTPASLPLAGSVKYIENQQPAVLSGGILSTPQKIDFHRSLFDTEVCETFTEVVITDPAHPYVLGTRLKVADGKVSEIETIVTDADDWLFKASVTLKYASAENWGEIPAVDRSSRATLVAAANAYFNLFFDPKTVVPWGKPCARLEGGIYTGKGRPDDTCNIGVPSGVPIVNRRFIVDEEVGGVVGVVTFGKNELPDSHMFRVEKDRIRYVHTITACKTFNCGFPTPAQLK